ncbi:MAG: hypothetical protein AAFZ65_20385, partial [Planctomycetota bacterium]
SRSLPAALAALCSAGPCFLGPSTIAAAQTGPTPLFVLDAQGGVGSDFSDLASAVAGVPDGATLLVRPGDYGGLVVDGKSLNILAPEAGVAFETAGAIRNLALGQRVVVRGVDFGLLGGTLLVADCDGSVWFEDVSLAFVSQVFLSGADAFTVVSSRFDFGGSISGAVDPLLAVDSSLALFDCVAEGSTGGVEFCVASAGLRANGASAVHAYDSTFTGSGCTPSGPLAPDAASGVVVGSSAVFFGRNVTAVGSTVVGNPAPPFEIAPGGVVTEVAGVARTLDAPARVRFGVPFDLALGGKPGELALVFAGADPSGLFVDPFLSTLALSSPQVQVLAATLDAAGQQSLTATVGALPGVEFTSVFLQAAHVDGIDVRLGHPTWLPILGG